MSGEFTALGFDPAPGDPGRGADLSRTLRRVTEALGEIRDVVDGAGRERWEGRAADEFGHLMSRELAPRLANAHESFARAARGFDRWLMELEDFQRSARRLESQAEQCRADLLRCDQALSAMGPRPTDEVAGRQYDDLRAQHETAVAAHRSDLEEVIGRARVLARAATDSASDAAGMLQVAMDAAPHAPGLWDKISHVVSSVGDFLGDCLEFVKDNWWNLLHQLVGTSASVFAVASIFCPALAPIALGLTVADVAMDGIDWARGVPGAREAFLTGAVGLAGGAAFGAVAKNFMEAAGPALAQGPYRLMATGGGAAGIAAPAAAVLSFNPGFRPALAGYVVLKGKDAKDASDAVMSLLGGNTYYSGSLAAGWQKARQR